MGDVARTRLRCPRCRSRDLLLMEIGTWWTAFQVKNGSFDRKGYHEPGEIFRLVAECTGCGHEWKVRGAIQITDICEEPSHD